ncbi:MAG TPA: tripartite tricarboxylate transporter substrate binding protein [Candidatus Mailhella excrementigallinarum]|jgi:tripartite-type tricarboxylate transporter receptor subunit TctC|nr:tripartite tricarboxylate transporter substrate binding protein [Candidatus Mailhella excrementigallinarum]
MSLEKLAALLMTVLFTALPAAAPAADYPTKPVRMIVGWAAGGGADLMIRLVEKEFEQEFGQPLTFVYKTGANGAIAAMDLKSARKDGYTIGSYCNPHLVTNILTKKGQYSLDDFSYLAQTAIDPAFLAVRKDSPINSVEDFVRAAESGKMLVGCIDYFGPTNFAALKMHKAGIPYSMTSFGSGPKTISAMLGGHVDAAFLMTGTSMSSISEMKVLAIATAERDPMFPDVPTFRELGYDIVNYLYRFWMAPKLRPEVEQRLADGLRAIYDRPEVIEKNARAGLQVQFLDGATLRKNIEASFAEAEELIEYSNSLDNK